MPRSPWREAIDGKIEVLRGLRGPGSLFSLRAYFEQAYSLTNVPAPERTRRAESMALAMRRQLQDWVVSAEPFALTNDIQNEIVRQVNQAGGGGPQPILDRALTRTYVRTHPPVPSGFVWLHEPVAICCSPPDEEVVSCVVQAILFSPASYVRAPGDHPDPTVPDPQGQSLRVVAFVDGDAAHSAWGMAMHSERPRLPFGLIPVMLPYIVEGETLAEQIELLLQRYQDDLIDQAAHAWPTMFLFILFELMAQRILLWGGSGLERDARKAAERNGLTPIVQVVTWRKADYRYPEGHIPAQIDWSCRWPVKEHTRHYKSGKTVVIKSYVKGPDGKPLKNPNQRVNLVRR